MGENEISVFIIHLATERKVAASTQNQALSAILFLYRIVLQRDLILPKTIIQNPHCSGTLGSQRCQDHNDLHPCSTTRRAGSEKSARQLTFSQVEEKKHKAVLDFWLPEPLSVVGCYSERFTC